MKVNTIKRKASHAVSDYGGKAPLRRGRFWRHGSHKLIETSPLLA